ncbi:MAG TPA: acyltransferase [Puia sp.]|uniref:acyltransferase family protein n=1 Tax=Puia sp. TaxID=2045100 RepID=UPI002B692D96|nr:acyltransferase [Puia sp.]HVU94954.1 acyltransferase [Puia sp.]
MRRAGYFPMLDILRWAACSAVVMTHSLDYFPSSAGELHFGAFIQNGGYHAVIFFYTLSGFLISYLLLVEKENTGGIALTAFYKRRALRIWPLYYLIILLSYFVFPYVFPSMAYREPGWWKVLLLYLVFLPNVAVIGAGGGLPTCFQTYTIAYEELFYLFWPLVVRKMRRSLPLFMVCLFTIVFLLEAAHRRIIERGLPLPDRWVWGTKVALTFIDYSSLPAFVAGAAGAWFYFKRRTMLRWLIGNSFVAVVLIAVTLLLMTFGRPHSLGYVNLLPVVFVMLILNLLEVHVAKSGNWLVKGGRISYGIYIYHPVVFLSLSTIMKRFGLAAPGMPLLSYIVYLGMSYFTVVGLSYLSYRYFEQFFLRKRPSRSFPSETGNDAYSKEDQERRDTEEEAVGPVVAAENDGDPGHRDGRR